MTTATADCCSEPNQYTTDVEGEAIYPDLCQCICHVTDEGE